MSDLELMTCTRRSLRLLPAACGRLYISANGKDEPAPWEGRAACRGCAIGARNAGRPVERLAEAAGELQRICTRCHAPAPRQIQGRWCVSCYNRHLEALKGVNAKGGRPQLLDRLHRVRVAAMVDRRRVPAAGPVVDVLEAMIAAARKAKNGAAFGAAPTVAWGRGQQELCL